MKKSRVERIETENVTVEGDHLRKPIKWEWTALKLIGGVLIALYLQSAIETVTPIAQFSIGLTRVFVVVGAVLFVINCEILPREYRSDISGRKTITALVMIVLTFAVNEWLAHSGTLSERTVHELRIAEAILATDAVWECVNWTIIQVRRARRQQRKTP